MNNFRHTISAKLFSIFILIAFLANSVFPTKLQAQTVLNLPAPGTIMSVSASFTPAMIKGITVYPNRPLHFSFIIHPGDDQLQGEDFKKESEKLIKYFLAALTVPEDEMWV